MHRVVVTLARVEDPRATGTTAPPVDPEAAADEKPSTAYRVRLDVFEGPFDLLLQLIARRKLDVTEVDLADITADFLAHLRLDDPESGIAELDLDTATHFLVIAATLIELKAARLLPADDGDELDELLAEARDVLYARLLEYRAFRDVSGLFAARFEAHAGYLPREAPLEPRFQDLVPDVKLPIDPIGLAALAASALAPRPEPKVSVAHIHRAYLSVREAANRLLARLRGAGERSTFREVVRGLTRDERVVHFLAVLELYKIGHLGLDQPEPFGELYLERREGGHDLALLDLAESDDHPDRPDDEP